MAILREKIFLYLIISLFFSHLSCAKNGDSIAKIELKNSSGKVIAYGKLAVCNESFEIPAMEIEQLIEYEFSICSDSGYDISLQFKDGSRMQKKLGYITHGMKNLKDQIAITDNDILLQGKTGTHIKGIKGTVPNGASLSGERI